MSTEQAKKGNLRTRKQPNTKTKENSQNESRAKKTTIKKQTYTQNYKITTQIPQYKIKLRPITCGGILMHTITPKL